MSAEEYVRDNHPDPDSVADTGEKWSSIFAMMNGYAQHKADEQSVELLRMIRSENILVTSDSVQWITKEPKYKTDAELLARFKQEKQ